MESADESLHAPDGEQPNDRAPASPTYTNYCCPACEYPLWDLKARACPECGRGFTPSEFRFTRGSVRFLCPHCAQAYYGTDQFGQLEPQSFTCISCAKHVTQDEMVVSLRVDVPEKYTATRAVPWLSKSDSSGKRRSILWRWFRTLGWSMGSAYALGRHLDRDVRAKPGLAFWFAFMTIGLSSLSWGGSFLFLLLFRGLGFPFSTRAGYEIAITLFLFPFLPLLVFVVWAVISHVALLVLGGSRGFGRTFQALMYSTGPMLVLSVPCVGLHLSVIGLVWSFVSAALILSAAHGIGAIRSLVAISAPFLLLAGVIAAVIYVRS